MASESDKPSSTKTDALACSKRLSQDILEPKAPSKHILDFRIDPNSTVSRAINNPIAEFDENGKKLRIGTYRPPPSELLSRLAAFLPQIAEANAVLANTPPGACLLEAKEDEEHYIEMDLGLGVFEPKTEGAVDLEAFGFTARSGEQNKTLDHLLISSDLSSSDDTFGNSSSDEEEAQTETIDDPKICP